ncbi:hypothetical protein [Synechococcus phage Ssp-JY38]|nr:hypothetical protein [Synechococcus phage Yong-L2-223]
MTHQLTIKRVLGSTPVNTHGGLARAVYWTLELNGVAISEENNRYLWSDDTSKIPDAPSSLAHLKTRIQEGLDATEGEHDRRVPRFDALSTPLKHPLHAHPSDDEPKKPLWIHVGAMVGWHNPAERPTSLMYQGYAVTVLALYDRTADVRMVDMQTTDGHASVDRHVLIEHLRPWVDEPERPTA